MDLEIIDFQLSNSLRGSRGPLNQAKSLCVRVAYASRPVQRPVLVSAYSSVSVESLLWPAWNAEVCCSSYVNLQHEVRKLSSVVDNLMSPTPSRGNHVVPVGALNPRANLASCSLTKLVSCSKDKGSVSGAVS